MGSADDLHVFKSVQLVDAAPDIRRAVSAGEIQGQMAAKGASTLLAERQREMDILSGQFVDAAKAGHRHAAADLARLDAIAGRARGILDEHGELTSSDDDDDDVMAPPGKAVDPMRGDGKGGPERKGGSERVFVRK